MKFSGPLPSVLACSILVLLYVSTSLASVYLSQTPPEQPQQHIHVAFPAQRLKLRQQELARSQYRVPVQYVQCSSLQAGSCLAAGAKHQRVSAKAAPAQKVKPPQAWSSEPGKSSSGGGIMGRYMEASQEQLAAVHDGGLSDAEAKRIRQGKQDDVVRVRVGRSAQSVYAEGGREEDGSGRVAEEQETCSGGSAGSEEGMCAAAGLEELRGMDTVSEEARAEDPREAEYYDAYMNATSVADYAEYYDDYFYMENVA